MHMHMRHAHAHAHMTCNICTCMHARLALQQRPEKLVDGAAAQPVLDLDAPRGLANAVHSVLRLQQGSGTRVVRGDEGAVRGE